MNDVVLTEKDGKKLRHLKVDLGDFTSKDIERFYSKTALDTSGCLLWQPTLDRDGYGSFHLYNKRGRPHVMLRAHRVAYILVHGIIPEDKQIDHLCRVKNCVNIDHLELVTPRENTLRGEGPAAKNAR